MKNIKELIIIRMESLKESRSKNIGRSNQMLERGKDDEARRKKNRRWMSAVIVSALLCSCFGGVTRVAESESGGCKDIVFVFARGSGAKLGEKDATAFRDEMTKVGRGLKTKFYELGSETHGGAQYPAASISDAKGLTTAVGALVSAGQGYEFGKSVDSGVAELKSYINETLAVCPLTQFVLGGYSQGAMVISEALPSLPSKAILYAATMGDPKLYLPEGENGDACRGVGLSDYRAYVPDCKVDEGILGGMKPYQTAEMVSKLGAWCNEEDVMCGARWNFLQPIQGHIQYVEQKRYVDVANKAAEKIKKAFPGHGVVASEKVSTEDVAILLDTTGSMEELINSYKEEALRLAKKVYGRGGRVALFVYRDLSDPFETQELCGFSCGYEELQQKLNSVTIGDGGDTDESALSGMLHVMNKLSWQKGANKSIVLLTDAGYHISDIDGVTLGDVVKRSLEIDPVNIYTITPENIMPLYTEVVNLTGGKSFSSVDEMEDSTEYILSRPVAKLKMASYEGAVGEKFVFDASGSTAEAGINHYEWDLDGDGEFEISSGESRVVKIYDAPMERQIQVKVVDNNSRMSTMSALVRVGRMEDWPEITNVTTEINGNVAKIKYQTNAARVLISMNGAVVGYTTGNEVIINEISEALTVSLVPYSSEGSRGETMTVVIERVVSRGETEIVSKVMAKYDGARIGVPDCGIAKKATK